MKWSVRRLAQFSVVMLFAVSHTAAIVGFVQRDWLWLIIPWGAWGWGVAAWWGYCTGDAHAETWLLKRGGA